MIRMFPVLWQGSTKHMRELELIDCPRMVPWSLVEPHERQAKRNHDQSLETLASRGGLCPLELCAVLADKPYRDVRGMPIETAVHLLKRFVGEHNAAPTKARDGGER
jgi:hypothetical protein